MATRRQEKVARIIRDAVSDAISNHLSDPRIEGLVSITRVEVAADLRSAGVYISILGKDLKSQDKTFAAITHAKNRIQSLLAYNLKIKFCPVLHFYKDDKFKKALETLKLIDQESDRLRKKMLERGISDN
jgi:ribosome-binding factor A